MNRISEIWQEVEAWASAEQVLSVGATSLEPIHFNHFREWLDAGHQASMAWLERHATVREHPDQRYPWAQSAIVITVPYEPERADDDSIAASIARYAQGDDYHDVMDGMLRRLEEKLETAAPGVKTWRYVDTGPLSDRSLGVTAGLGWIGRNAMLIHEKHGSWFFIGVLLTSLTHDLTAELASDRCGSCTRCIDACPTDAIVPGRMVDSSRCISHATIEQRGELPPFFADTLGSNVFGCDICQEVCPWNRRPAAGHPSLAPRESYRARPVSDLLRMDQTDFSALFRGSAVKRAKRVGMLRNALLASGDTLSTEELETLSGHEDPGVAAAARLRLLERAHASGRNALRSRSNAT